MASSASAPKSGSSAQWPWIDALFADLPYVVDSLWRHGEYNANRNHVYDPADGGIRQRLRECTLAFPVLVLALTFVVYGPTFRSLCVLGGQKAITFGYLLLAVLPLLALGLLLARGRPILLARCEKRLKEVEAGPVRRGFLWLAAWAALAGGCIVLGFSIYAPLHLASVSAECMPVPQAISNGQFARSIGQLALLAATCIAVVWASRRWSGTDDWVLIVSLIVIAAWLLNWFALASPEAREADQAPYRHVFGLLAAALFIIALSLRWWAKGLFHGVAAGDLQALLKTTELFQVRDKTVSVSDSRIAYAIINGPIYHPLHWFLPAGLTAIMASDNLLWPLCLAALAIGWLLLIWGSMSARWQEMITFVNRWFFTGTPLAISLLVIVLAYLRLSGNLYIATIFGAMPFGILFVWVLMGYALFWLFEYIINQPLGVRLLDLLQPGGGAERGYVPYPAPDAVRLLAAPDHRYLAIQGAGRFAVVGRFLRGESFDRAFQTYEFLELFSALAANAPAVALQAGYPDLVSQAERTVHDLGRRIKLYFNVANLGVVAVIVLLAAGYICNRTDALVAAREADASPPAGSYDLAGAIRQKAKDHQPLYIVAASGGGTRAALFTASALRGMDRAGILKNVALMSGVSGGGVALAYYAVNESKVTSSCSAPPCPQDWDEFEKNVASPFIEDVLAGAMEWRLSRQASISSLLQESLQRRLDGGQAFTMGRISQLGLILNTSIAGHPAADSEFVDDDLEARGQPLQGQAARLPYKFLSGSRLVFTNLSDRDAFPHFGKALLADVNFPFEQVNDGKVPVMTAAELNANFPPVFPNAPVRIAVSGEDRGSIYEITDGGAVENLGLISALYALKHALSELQQKDDDETADWGTNSFDVASCGKSQAMPDLPPIHIVAIEASANDLDYSQDHGVDVGTDGGKARLAGGLTQRLLQEVNDRVKCMSNSQQAVATHYITMPLALRSRGGVGTHWMLQNRIEVANPHLPRVPGLFDRLCLCAQDNPPKVQIDKDQLLVLLNALNAPDGKFCDPDTAAFEAPKDSELKTVAGWICGDGRWQPDLGVAEWKRLVAAGPPAS